MSNRLRALSALTALFLALGVLPALADEGEVPADTGTEETSEDDENARLNGKFLILFAEGFDAEAEDLALLTELGFGWGDLFKLNLYSSALGIPIDELIAAATFDEETGEYEFGWGELKQALTDEQLEALDAMPRNFGQMVSEDRRHQGRDEHRPEHAGGPESQADRPDNPNKPDHARQGGRSGK